ncbi:WecB/TagA/CpsF family glycosyltransferase [Fodinibius sediminis]|uniref:UDP-N-acetyl-D-mannosaminouronate:lipid I N-acetyl-D-mannosaminouronosyltransferase n=1 Tax=Fodinibius sediminis TaxID=1214077 RepID=A0A521EUD9_9BACT|nr:WecB/TagA/CpsF family glycosyltransferase [Fodinibius sediminis]SMO87532.1 UDP-N-acetyl-D-mannosaminouronate:lipid I N-acetyl-D-mannosaminouronosyltransferase [Fodinibius sediminis]
MKLQTTYLNNYKIYPFENRDQFLDYLNKGNSKNILVALNAEKLVKQDPQLRKLVNQNIGYPDGIGPVLALTRKNYDTEKIPGSEFWLDVIKRFYKKKTFYLIGSKQHVIETTVANLEEDFPGIQIINYRNGYMNTGQEKKVIKDIVEKKPDVVFVAMGSPKQEFLMQRMQQKHKALYMGLGGSFDIYSGEKERAPKLMRKMGLEWSYRLFKEPKRIFRQTSLMTFAYMLLTNKL